MVEVQQRRAAEHPPVPHPTAPPVRFKEDAWCGKHLNDSDGNAGKNVYNYAARNKNAEKTPMCRVAELARHHKLKHEYVLLDESGPAHKKQFTVKLVLKPGEEYEGSGASIKKAQQAAAENALQHTALPRPPKKPNKTKSDTNPVWLLYSVANQVKLDVRYEVQPPECGPVTPRSALVPPPLQMPLAKQFGPMDCGISRPPLLNCPPPPMNSLLFGLTRSFNQPPTPPNGFNGIPPPPMQRTSAGSPFSEPPPTPEVICRPPPWPPIGASPFAPPSFSPNVPPPPFHEAPTPLFQQRPFRSPIPAPLHKGSKVEAELKSNGEQRPAEGEANEKKRSFPSSDEHEWPGAEADMPIVLSASSNNSTDSGEEDENEAKKEEAGGEHDDPANPDGPTQQRRPKPKCCARPGEPHNRRYVIRCSLSSPRSAQPIVADGEGSSKKCAKQNACQLMLDKVADVENDPVYLASLIVRQKTKRKTIIKVMQIRKEPEPVFNYLDERGQHRYREFVVEVTCMGITQMGVGPNKKLAKRAAAVAMLDAIGYAKPMPQPGKSLLKKRSSDALGGMPVEIGVFDPDHRLRLPATVDGAFGTFEDPFPPQTASNSPPPLTFADVDHVLAAETAEQCTLEESSPSPVFSAPLDLAAAMRERSDSEQPAVSSSLSSNDEPQPLRSQRRRVTFSNQALIAPLKSEVVLVTKLKKRGRDSKKALNGEEKGESGRRLSAVRRPPERPQAASRLRAGRGARHTDRRVQSERARRCRRPPRRPSRRRPGVPNAHGPLEVRDAKCCLERLARAFKFTVSYSDFPRAAEEAFSLVTVGLDRPILRHGCGPTEDAAHNDAAYNAILELAALDSTGPPPPMLNGP
ncbi:hypothetical protein M3Y99_01115300 [Aphelenchoides fujianensis]|nr:hypothetical protein M3Y99_01115300 [Aphelenchoides fujianensis]